MKIKVVYGVDMRLWKKYADDQAKPDDATFTDLLAYIRETFSFAANHEFRVTFKDDDDEFTTIASVEDLRDAFALCQQQDKKSLKLHVVNTAKVAPKSNNSQAQEQEEKEGQLRDDCKVVMESNLQATACTGNDGDAVVDDAAVDIDAGADADSKQQPHPTKEEITAFLSDDLSIDLLSDLFVSVFDALRESQYEISFMECVRGVILSSDAKYAKIISNPVWPYFEHVMLPKCAPRIEAFLVPMMQMNGGANDAIKQFIPTILNRMKTHVQNGDFMCGGGGASSNGEPNLRGGFPGWHHGWHRGRGGGGGWPWRGGHPHHPHAQGPHPHPYQHPFHPHPRPPPACGGRGQGWRGRGRGREWRARRGRGSCNMWQQQSNHVVDEQQQQQQNAPFAYTEELVAIMNMGFGDVAEIKRLLVLHKGSKENVIQKLISNSKK